MIKENFKILTLAVLIISSINSIGQNADIKTFFNICNSEEQIKWDSISFESQTVRYKIFKRTKQYSKGTFNFYSSEILLPDFNSNSDKEYVARLLVKIGEFHFTHEFIAFKDCRAQSIFYQGIKPSKQQNEYVKQNLIGVFKTENK